MGSQLEIKTTTGELLRISINDETGDVELFGVNGTTGVTQHNWMRLRNFVDGDYSCRIGEGQRFPDPTK